MTEQEYAEHNRWKDMQVSNLCRQSSFWLQRLDPPLGEDAKDKLKWLVHDAEMALKRCTVNDANTDMDQNRDQPTHGSAPVLSIPSGDIARSRLGIKTRRSSDAAT